MNEKYMRFYGDMIIHPMQKTSFYMEIKDIKMDGNVIWVENGLGKRHGIPEQANDIRPTTL